MNPIIKNFVSVIRRFKLAATLNLLGLSVAFAAFIVIMIQLDYDYGFDKFHKDSDKIFRLELYVPQLMPTRIPIVSRPFGERFIESSPHILAGAISNPIDEIFGGGEAKFHIETEGERNYFKEKILVVAPEYFDVFTFDFVEGTKDVYIAPGNMFIPLSLKLKLFGNEPAVGKQFVHTNWGNQTVLGVYRDFPVNTSIRNCIYFAMQPDENKTNWGNFQYCTYVRLNNASNAQQVIDNFKQNFDFTTMMGDQVQLDMSGLEMYLTALPDIHFLPHMQYDSAPKASRQTLLILLTIAIMIVSIAAINFTNFSTALTPMRIKSINTQRVLGVRQATIRRALVFEVVLISFVSFLVSLLLVTIFNHTSAAQLVNGDLSLMAHPLLVGGSALVALLTGFVAGTYPARYMTSFAPALVLKGSFALSPKGRQLRNSLIGIQFIASFALIIGSSFMYLQNRYMQHSPMGYDKEALLAVNIGKIIGSRDAFTNQVKTYAGVADVTYSQFLLSSSDMYMKWGRPYRGDMLTFQVLPVHHTFLQMMGITVTEGRDFRREDLETEYGAFIFNESARTQFNLELNTMTDNAEIIGFIPDIKYASFRVAIEPMAFYVPGTTVTWVINNINIASIKLNKGADLRAAIAHINATLKEFDANETFEINFFDEVLQKVYDKETDLSTLITLFSLIAIFISIVGVFGLVVFDSECRRKEIGVRKVLGASTISILIMFNKAYFKILMICFVVAAPLAWYGVSRWLQNFAYKTPMYWWVYVLAFVAVGVITACTVTFQNMHVANDDPLKAIKTD